MADMLDWLRIPGTGTPVLAHLATAISLWRVATRTPVSLNSSDQAGDEGPDRR